MTQTIDLTEFEILEETEQQPLQEELGSSCSTPSQLRPMQSSQIEAELGITKRMIQLWFPLVQQAYPWMPESELKIGRGKYLKYSTFCIEQFLAIQKAKTEGKTNEEWLNSVKIYEQKQFSKNEPVSAPMSAIIPQARRDAVLANEKLESSAEVLADTRQTLQDAYQQQPTLAKNLAKLFAARFKEEFANEYASEVKQAVGEVLQTTEFER
ncbi:hypothetical protein NIES2101_37395 [Calothrix sp. HK-06]|nr:hypothetical protein NIES2101_37395 [Calothrix sp. HK-06]